MAVCPRCNSEIDYLRNFEKCWEEYRFTVRNGCAKYEYTDNTISFGEQEYECPECGEVLFYSEVEAVNFLRGENHKERG